jgi:hypothetical protein
MRAGRGLGPVAIALLIAPILSTSCKGCGASSDGAPSGAASGSGSAASSATMAASGSASAAPSSALKLIAKGDAPLILAGVGQSAVVLSSKVAIAFEDGKTTERPELLRGLENPYWTERRFLGTSAGAVAFIGKRDPMTLWPGDSQMYAENVEHCGEKPGPPGKTVPKFCLHARELTVRAFQIGAWMRRDPREQWYGGVGRLFGRLVVAVTDDDDGPDYAFALLAGKPGIVLPRRTKLPKAGEAAPPTTTAPAPTEASAAPSTIASTAAPVPSESAAPVASAPASASAAPSTSAPVIASASAAPSTSASAAPADAPKLPIPGDPRCRSRVLPIAFDGLDAGEMFLLGRTCGGAAGDLWIEHWKKPSDTSEFIPVTGLSDPRRPASVDGDDYVEGIDDLAVAAIEPGVAVLAQRSTGTLLELRDGRVSRLDSPAAGAIEAIAASPGGRLWLVIDGRVYWRKGTATWQSLLLPEGKRATMIAPSDDDTPLIACRTELYGPASMAPAEPLDLTGTVTSLCAEPWVILNGDLPRGDEGKAGAEQARGAGVAGITLFTGYRGMGGKHTLEAKAPDVATARALAAKVTGATLTCGGPRGQVAVK